MTKLPLNRRQFLTNSSAGIGLALSAVSRLSAEKLDNPLLVTSFRSKSNAYSGAWERGAHNFSDSVGAKHLLLETDGHADKELENILQMAKIEGSKILNLDITDKSNLEKILQICFDAKIYVITNLNGASPIHPTQFSPFYVANVATPNVRMGREMAEVLFHRMGGSGGIGILGGGPHFEQAIQRKAGLERALESHPHISVLDYQIPNWLLPEAADTVKLWLIRYGKQLKGIWAANDDMALGAVLTLRRYNLTRKIAVTGFGATKDAIEAVGTGELEATVCWEPFWRGGIGLAIGYYTATGDIDWAKEGPHRREFYGRSTAVTSQTIESFVGDHVYHDPDFFWKDIWGGTFPLST